jgi:hypothetical protein
VRAPQSPFANAATNTHRRPHFALHGHAFNPDTGKIAEYRELSQCSEGCIWQGSNCEEIGRLAQGFGDVKGTNTIIFIPVSSVPKGRKVTYLRVVSAMRPEKDKPYRVRWTVGGDKIDYPFDVSTKTADLTTTKLLLNSVVSTPNAQFLTADLKDFYLGTPMSRYEYMRVPIWMLPDAIIEQYMLRPLFHNGYIYVEIRRGMYGLPQAGRIANDQLVAFLQPHGYAPCPLTHGLCRHHTRNIVFSLVVDDFGVRYTNRADADHLIATLRTAYEVSLDQIYWSKGQTNRADYFSKHHPASHHQAIRSAYLYSPTTTTRNYFDCLADTPLTPSPPLPRAHSLTTDSVDSGELVRVCYEPRGTRSVTMTSSMTSPCLIARTTQSLAHNLCSSSFDLQATSLNTSNPS